MNRTLIAHPPPLVRLGFLGLMCPMTLFLAMPAAWPRIIIHYGAGRNLGVMRLNDQNGMMGLASSTLGSYLGLGLRFRIQGLGFRAPTLMTKVVGAGAPVAMQFHCPGKA